MGVNQVENLPLEKLLICVTFHYVDSRLQYLEKISHFFSSLAQEVVAVIITNTVQQAELDRIHTLLKKANIEYEVISPSYLGHSFLLPWTHLGIFRERFLDKSFSHFLYLEDDICIESKNIQYWVQGRKLLKPFGLIPSFFRYEYPLHEKTKLATDLVRRVNYYLMPKILISSSYAFINLPNAYQACYLMDRELLSEHLQGESSHPDFGRWDVRARAASGLTFANVPKGFWSRNLVGVHLLERQIDSGAFIHHVPNNYALDKHAPNAKIPVMQILQFDWYLMVFAKLQKAYLTLKKLIKLKKKR